MNDKVKLFYDIGEPFGAGLFEMEGQSVARRYCRAFRRFFEYGPIEFSITDWPVYPSGYMHNENVALMPNYCRQMYTNWGLLEKKSHEAVELIRDFQSHGYDFVDLPGRDVIRKYAENADAWNHSAPNYTRIIGEGLDSYQDRINQMKDEDLKEALTDVVIGIRRYCERTVEYLESINADKKLIAALKNVPFKPASTAYEALVCANLIFYIDGCDNIGYVDPWLNKLWKGEDLVPVMHCIMKNMEEYAAWSISIGPVYNELTKQWIRASEGCARPMIELRTLDTMPDDIWEAALERILKGGGQPAFYNEKAIKDRLRSRIPNITEEDLNQFCGMGCTETSFTGLTYCGGIDLNLNVLKIFEECMNTRLRECSSFEAFYEYFLYRIHEIQDFYMDFMNRYYNKRAKYCFAPARTLFTDDCITNEKGFFQGGARYTFAIPSDSGIPNTLDSLLAVKDLIFDKKEYTADEFISCLNSQDPKFVAALKTCPVYGTYEEDVNKLVNDFTSRYYAHYKTGRLDIGIGFLPTSHQFLRHVSEGRVVGNTPDGRLAGEAVADSIAPVNGKATKGPAIMLMSASCYEQKDIYGIPVLNLSISPKTKPAVLRALVEGYLEMGGTQIQITCTDVETLIDAQKNPDKHRDLIVRIGGYSDYFCNIGRELQDAVINRTIFEC